MDCTREAHARNPPTQRLTHGMLPWACRSSLPHSSSSSRDEAHLSRNPEPLLLPKENTSTHPHPTTCSSHAPCAQPKTCKRKKKKKKRASSPLSFLATPLCNVARQGIGCEATTINPTVGAAPEMCGCSCFPCVRLQSLFCAADASAASRLTAPRAASACLPACLLACLPACLARLPRRNSPSVCVCLCLRLSVNPLCACPSDTTRPLALPP
ncbi:hypothetical protein IWX46DRAFT_256515 [Phyllosticta citricarpa]|uniref:Uncharacterized protein n=1 Tax=Phyllosticta citricarpa TaxID=55181 RepID=A0ABR1LV81_9PEZI